MRRLRRILIGLGIANLLLAVATEVVASAGVALAYGVITSAYRELDYNGVIAHDKLAQTWGPDVAEDWTRAVKTLIDEPLRGFYDLSHLATGAFAINGVILIYLGWNVRRDNRAE